jgi:hypothetical protein
MLRLRVCPVFANSSETTIEAGAGGVLGRNRAAGDGFSGKALVGDPDGLRALPPAFSGNELAGNRDHNLWWVPESNAYPVMLISRTRTR